MNLILINRVLVTLVCVVVCQFVSVNSSTDRSLEVRVYHNGKMILKGSFSDNGRQNADEVWNSYVVLLKQNGTTARLEATDFFDESTLVEDEKSENSVLDGSYDFSSERPKIAVWITHGGIAFVDKLQLKVGKKPNGTNFFQLDAKQLQKVFDSRMLFRSKVKDINTK